MNLKVLFEIGLLQLSSNSASSNAMNEMYAMDKNNNLDQSNKGSKEQVRGHWIQLYDRTVYTLPRSTMEHLKKLYFDTFPSARYGFLDGSTAIDTTDKLNSERGEYGRLENQRRSSENNSNELFSMKDHPEFPFLEWKLPKSSHVIDITSGVPFSHIILLCKHLICAKCNCRHCNHKHAGNVTLRLIAFIAATTSEGSDQVTMCGSYAEGCEIPQYWVKNHSTGKYVRKQSDVDLMFELIINETFNFGFHADSKANVNTILDTRFTKPGYLRFRRVLVVDPAHQQKKRRSRSSLSRFNFLIFS